MTQYVDGRGTNQSGMRVSNERLILQLIRRTPGLAKAEIARLTGLTPQATTIIVNRLEDDGLLLRQPAVRGRVGQPAIPYELAPEGVMAAGLQVGRRHCELILVDFVANIRHRRSIAYDYPVPDVIVDFTAEAYRDLAAQLPAAQRQRLCGLGVAMPFQLWDWEEAIRVPRGALAIWQHTDLAALLRARMSIPVHLCNDATAACGAELVFGGAQRFQDFIYVFMDTLVGGGVVLGGKVFNGRTGNAGAIGSLPVPDLRRLKVNQLIDWASLIKLEERLIAKGMPGLPRGEMDWCEFGPDVIDWIDNLAPNLAIAALSAAAFFEIEAIVIDGAFPAKVCARICEAVRGHVEDFDRQGVSNFEVAEGRLGFNAAVIGAAALPLLDFSRDAAD